MLATLGARAEQLADGLIIPTANHSRLRRCASGGDHRIAMAAVAALAADGASVTDGFAGVATSNPGLFETTCARAVPASTHGATAGL
jgi:5-enolpyruvylshikimate-3-phosphate synthase